MKIKIGDTINFIYQLEINVNWLQADEYHEHWCENQILVDQLKDVIKKFMFEKKILIKRDYLEELINSNDTK